MRLYSWECVLWFTPADKSQRCMLPVDNWTEVSGEPLQTSAMIGKRTHCSNKCVPLMPFYLGENVLVAGLKWSDYDFKSVKNEEWHTTKKQVNRLSCVFFFLIKEESVYLGWGFKECNVSSLHFVSLCRFHQSPRGRENFNRPLLRLMPGPYIIRVHILMLWTGAWEQIFVQVKWHLV